MAQVWVAAGSYRPGVNASDAFALRTGVAIYGGFSGDESLLGERDWPPYATILSGDLLGDDPTIDGIVIDPNLIAGTNAFHVVTANGVDPTAVLDGFIVTGGSAEGVENDGGGIACGDGSPALRNLTVQGDRALGDGGGLHGSGAPTLEAVAFRDNIAGRGGAIAMTGGMLTFRRGTLTGNEASSDGGAVMFDAASSTLARLLITNNEAGSAGGGLSFTAGNHELHNTALGGNHALLQGGAWHAASVTLKAINITAVANFAEVAGGFYSTGTSAVTIGNSLIYDNGQLAGVGTLAANHFNSGTTPVVTHSLLQGSGGSNVWDSAAGIDGGNNIDEDPVAAATRPHSELS